MRRSDAESRAAKIHAAARPIVGTGNRSQSDSHQAMRLGMVGGRRRSSFCGSPAASLAARRMSARHSGGGVRRGVRVRCCSKSSFMASVYGVRWQSEASTPLLSPGVAEHRRCTARPLRQRGSGALGTCQRLHSGVALRFPPHSIVGAARGLGRFEVSYPVSGDRRKGDATGHAVCLGRSGTGWQRCSAESPGRWRWPRTSVLPRV